MGKSRRKRVKRKQTRKVSSSRKRKKFPFKLLLILFFSFALIGYVVYLSILITGIKKNDPLSENGSSTYLLSSGALGDLEKTLWIFEDGDEEEDSSIQRAFLVASNKEKNFLINVHIPGWIYYDFLSERNGNALTVSNFRYAGDFLKENRGMEYAIWQFEQMLGTKVDNYVWVGGEEQSLYSDVFGYFKEYRGDFRYNSEEKFTEEALQLDSFITNYSVFKIPFSPQSISKLGEGLYSNKRFPEVLLLISSYKRRLNTLEKHIIDLGQEQYLKEELSNKGGMAYYFNSFEYDKKFRSFLLDILDRELEKEQVRVEVYNGSGISGAAGQMARRIENSGCDVVRYENAPDIAGETVLYIPDEERFDKSISVVQEVVGSSTKIVNGRPDFMTTGDIVVLLGEDIERMYSF